MHPFSPPIVKQKHIHQVLTVKFLMMTARFYRSLSTFYSWKEQSKILISEKSGMFLQAEFGKDTSTVETVTTER